MSANSLEHFQAEGAPAPGGSYSHGVVAHGFLYTCGMGPVDPVSGKVVEGDITAQTRQVLKNLEAILKTKGATFAQVVKVTTHLQELHRFCWLRSGLPRIFVCTISSTNDCRFRPN